MRAIFDLIDALADAVGVLAVAVGGSSTRDESDAWSDEDYFVFASDAQFTEAARNIHDCLQCRAEALFVGNWGFSHRFGLKMTIVDHDFSTRDVFLNCPLTFAPLPMTRNMRFCDEASKFAFEAAFKVYGATLPESLAYLVASASSELYDALHGMRKGLMRRNPTGYAFYFRRFEIVISALRLHLEQDIPYDPHLVERRRVEDFGLADIFEGEPLGASIARSLALLRRFELRCADKELAEQGIRRAIACLET